MILIYILSIVLFSFNIFHCAATPVLPVALSAISLATAASSFKQSPLSASRDEICLESVTFSIEEGMNYGAAARLHLVLVYKKDLLQELMRWNSRDYFFRAEQLKKDNPNEIKILEWEIKSEKNIFTWSKKAESSFKPALGCILFVDFSSIGEHRANLSHLWKNIKITLLKEDFKVESLDKENS